MKVLLVSHSNGGGGAGRAAQRLFSALDESGTETSVAEVAMYADFRHGWDPRVATVHGPFAEARRRLRITTEEIPALIARHPEPRLFSPAIAGGISARRIDAAGADVVNLHWTGFGTLSIRQAGRIRTPIVWTMHDMWAFTGGLGYDREDADARWRDGYRSPTSISGWDVERWVAQRKRRHWRTPEHLVAPSSWLARLASQSDLLGDWPVTVIPNPLDTTVFAPMPMSQARAQLGLPQDAPLIVTVLGTRLDDPRKGFDLLRDALGTLAVPGAQLAVVGHDAAPQDWPDGLLPVTWLGHLDDAGMVAAYSAADVVVVPSRQDNLPQTATEAQACGAPVVAFDTGGLSDTLVDGTTGLLTRPFDAAELAAHLTRLLTDPDLRARQSAAARERAVREWSPAVIASAYADVFAAAARA